MASPFRLFRKYVKPMLAFFVVMLIFSWAVGDSLFNYFGGSRNPAVSSQRAGREVAVRWDGGKLTNQQVNDLVVRRQMLNGFLERVEGMGARSAYEAGVEPRRLRVQRLLGPGTPQEHVEESVVQTRLFADAARAAGMHVSDEAIVQYLDELGRGNVTRNDMRDILNTLYGGRGGVSIDEIMATLREEMLARNYVNSNQYAFETVTPEQRWRDWLRVNDRVVVEAAAIPTEKFIGDVKAPTEAELQAFFEKTDSQGIKYKDREASPEIVYGTTELPSAIPGFRIPRKIDVQFIEANYDSFLAKAEEKVTDEEIAKYYEEHKDPMFVKADTGLLEDTGAKKDADTTENPAAPEGGEKTNDETPADTAPPPPVEESKGEAKAEGKKASWKKASPKKSKSEEGKSEESKQSSLPGRANDRVFHLVAFEEAAQGDAPVGDAEKGAAESPAAEATEKPTEGAAAAPAATESAPVAVAPPAAEAASPPAAPEAPKKPLVFQPLDEVKDVIRRELAGGKVAEELTKLARDIGGALDSDFSKYLGEVLSAQDDKKAPPAVPKSLTDLAPLAEKNGLKSGKTGSMSFLQMRDMPIGKSSIPESGRTLLSMLFGGKELDLYQPVSTVDIDGNHYVSMKTSDTPGRVPTLAEVRDEVVKAWKYQQAADLARKYAEEVAKKAQEAKTPLPAFFADDPSIKVVRTDPFSELTGGEVGFANGQFQPTPFRLSQPADIAAPGPDFLKRVFELKDGEVAAALNHDHSIAYVVRLVEHQPPLDELRTAYLAEANTWPGISNMTRVHMQEVLSAALQRHHGGREPQVGTREGQSRAGG